MDNPRRPDVDQGDNASAAEPVLLILGLPMISILPPDRTEEELDQALDFLYAEAEAEDNATTPDS